MFLYRLVHYCYGIEIRLLHHYQILLKALIEDKVDLSEGVNLLAKPLVVRFYKTIYLGDLIIKRQAIYRWFFGVLNVVIWVVF